MENRSNSNIHLLKKIAELLNEETELQQMLSCALQVLINGTDFSTGWIFFIDKSGGHSLEAYHNIPSSLSEEGCCLLRNGGCWCVNRFRAGKLTKASNIIECQRIEKSITEERGDTGGIVYHATVPLQSGNESFGLLNVAAPEKTHFHDHELALLESVAFQIGSAIKRVMLTKKEQEVALMQERNRLARDLHDSVNQLLFSLTLTARGGTMLSEDQNVKETFSTIQSLAQEALTEMRALIWQLKPQGLENGFGEAVKGYAGMLGMETIVKVEGVVALPSKIEEALWRIGQEAVNNAKKHSGQDCIYFFLKTSPKLVVLQIEDKGCGFQYSPSRSIPSMGIQGMKERAANLGGEFHIDSRPGSGTKITVEIPY
ncbi:GAF domain-containing protein [Bacillus salacetis]|uniref:histidine kinase n=1 Tax=Bacillus salacetis TaxID=2315464 RepID=A0A3A1QR72_9BACI|nr:GAF domain-containing sensor histidine kinase [Bacillus salacetis]RIW29620.1 GAF domain-containing protein [Bacillus salacetis]